MPLDELNAAASDHAAAALEPCCASRAWIVDLVAGRPYPDLAALQARSDDVLANLAWSDVREALEAHPRIGDRIGGGGREAGWSRQEQSATADVDVDVREALRRGNVSYEDRFGFVFLICASGLSAEQMLEALRARLGNDAESEKQVVRRELTAIVRLRLGKAFG